MVSIDGVRGLLPLRATGFLQHGIAVYSSGLLNSPMRLRRRLLPFLMLGASARKPFACIKGAACCCLLPFSYDDGIAVYYGLFRQTCWYIGCLLLIGRLGLFRFIAVSARCLVAVCYRCAQWRTCWWVSWFITEFSMKTRPYRRGLLIYPPHCALLFITAGERPQSLWANNPSDAQSVVVSFAAEGGSSTLGSFLANVVRL